MSAWTEIAALRKQIVSVLPDRHNIDVDIFTERLHLRGVRVTPAKSEETEDTHDEEQQHSLVHADVVARQLRVSNWTIYKMAKAGLMPSVRVGQRGVRFHLAEVETWIANGGLAKAQQTIQSRAAHS